jgi:hypothetical protein
MRLLQRATTRTLALTMPTLRLNRLTTTPDGGRELWAYTAAILEVTGMMSAQPFPLDQFYDNFSGHKAAGRIVKAADGYILSPDGYRYFSGRLTGENSQRIDRAAVLELIRLIVAPEPAEGWEAIEYES